MKKLSMVAGSVARSGGVIFGLNKDNLAATAKAYNEAYDADKEAEFGLPRENMISMGKAPYYGFTVMAVSIGSIPGPQVNNGVQVLD